MRKARNTILHETRSIILLLILPITLIFLRILIHLLLPCHRLKKSEVNNTGVTDMTSCCRKRTEVTFDKSPRTQNTIIQNSRNQRKLIYLI